MAENTETTLWQTVKAIRTCMMTSSRDGKLVSRPMAAYARPEEKRFYFVTRLDTEKTREIADGEAVNLAFADPGKNDWVSVEGYARVMRDEAKQQELWNFFAEAWVPEGPRDQNVGLIEVTPEHATLWSGPSWTVTHLWKAAVANVLQEEPKSRKQEVELG
ncbi:MAG: pyridoxamine 5'-phosphate oxidase family protein [Sphingomonadaceae bacterium]|nr:pyridoxamine 5'-phosphate oxidase family protein [Sphingomonadaceae bacterium]